MCSDSLVWRLFALSAASSVPWEPQIALQGAASWTGCIGRRIHASQSFAFGTRSLGLCSCSGGTSRLLCNYRGHIWWILLPGRSNESFAGVCNYRFPWGAYTYHPFLGWTLRNGRRLSWGSIPRPWSWVVSWLCAYHIAFYAVSGAYLSWSWSLWASPF